ncbi:MAG: FUSC family protein, partial [Flavobacteriaceae bacterium]|nr:FUSC family protein [Flavobacteriaceae bacterium]
ALSILPFGSIALIPIVLGLIFGLLAFNASKKEGKNVSGIKFIFLLLIIALGLTIYRAVFDQNIVEDDIETIQNEEESLEDAKKELEDIEIDE